MQSENKENSKKEIKSEKILICISIFMFALVIGYNAFYVSNSSEVIEISSNIVHGSSSGYKFNLESENQSESLNSIVNLNTASESELTSLNGIGPAIAKRIIEYRESYGGFSNIDEIKNVRGIGEKLFEKIKMNICV